jgi:hypothetical protein
MKVQKRSKESDEYSATYKLEGKIVMNVGKYGFRRTQ